MFQREAFQKGTRAFNFLAFLGNVTFSNRNSPAIFTIFHRQKRRNLKNITNVVFKKRCSSAEAFQKGTRAFNFLAFLENVTFSNRNSSAIFTIFHRRVQISKVSRIVLGRGKRKRGKEKKKKFTIKPRSFAESLMNNARIDHGK